MTKKFSPYKFLTHAAIHCRFGSDTVDREPTQADLQAEKILLACRMKLSGSHIHAGFGCPLTNAFLSCRSTMTREELIAMHCALPSIPDANAPCHYGLVPQDKCSNCQRLMKAHKIIADALMAASKGEK